MAVGGRSPLPARELRLVMEEKLQLCHELDKTGQAPLCWLRCDARHAFQAGGSLPLAFVNESGKEQILQKQLLTVNRPPPRLLLRGAAAPKTLLSLPKGNLRSYRLEIASPKTGSQ